MVNGRVITNAGLREHMRLHGYDSTETSDTYKLKDSEGTILSASYPFGYMGLGISNTVAPLATDEALADEVSATESSVYTRKKCTKTYYEVLDTETNEISAYILYSGIWAPGEIIIETDPNDGAVGINEIGLFNQASGGVMCFHETRETVTFNWEAGATFGVRIKLLRNGTIEA